jgi:pyruvate kinase
MEYEIIATLGPKSSTEPLWLSLLSAGASSFRLNTSHLSLEQLEHWLHRLLPFLKRQGLFNHLVLDLQGSKWRLGDFTRFFLEPGQAVELVCAPSAKNTGIVPVPHQDFFQAALCSDGTIVLNDARIVLAVEKADALTLQARVVSGGEISSRKGITCSSTSFRRESLGEKDVATLNLTKGMDGVRYAISYVKDAKEMAWYRTMTGDQAYVIAKLERKDSLEGVEGIAMFSDELWLCRGDLGAEMGLVAMAEAVHRISDKVHSISKPVILAGQVLEHMTTCPVPTRSEVCCLHDALLNGYKGIVLSDETAVGKYPVESCQAAAMFKTCVPSS